MESGLSEQKGETREGKRERGPRRLAGRLGNWQCAQRWGSRRGTEKEERRDGKFSRNERHNRPV